MGGTGFILAREAEPKDGDCIKAKLKDSSDFVRKKFGNIIDRNVFDVALEYIEQLEAAQPKWISVEERLPENEKTVLAVTKHSFATHNGIREITTISAVFHTDGKTFSGDSKYNFETGDVELIYDEDNDEYIVPEGWWESTYFTEEFAAVDEEVLYWMPLPEPPKEASHVENR